MQHHIRIYFRLLGIAIASQMQYKVSFFLLLLAQFIGTCAEMSFIGLLFWRFDALGDWSFAHVALLYGIVECGFALAEGLARGFDTFSEVIKSGDFDRILLRPTSPLIQIAAKDVQFFRLGRFLQGATVLTYAIVTLSLFSKLIFIIFCMMGSTLLFIGIFILQAAVCFWTVEGLEVMNILTYGGAEAGQYPASIYDPWMQKLFLYIVPVAATAYVPSLWILEKTDNSAYMFAPLMSGVFFLAACALWNCGVRRYTSCGS